MKFNVNNYKGKYAMHCKNEKEAKEFRDYMRSIDKLMICTLDCYYGENVCLFNHLTWTSINYAKAEGYTILEWSDFMNKEFTIADLRTGDVIQRKCGDVEIVIKELGVLLRQNGWNRLGDFQEDLTHSYLNNEDIIAVRRPWNPSDCQFDAFKKGRGTLVYERKEVEEMTLAEVCRLLGREIKIIK